MKLQKNLQLICIILAVITLCACGSRRESGIVQSRMGSGATAPGTLESISGTESVPETEEAEIENELYIITGIDTAYKVVAFQQVSSGRQLQYAYDVGTRFLNKYGDTMALESFQPGDVAEIQVSSRTGQLSQVQLSGQVWVQEDIVNYSVDESIHAFTIGKTKYVYEEGLGVFSKDTMININSLGDADVLRAVGKDKKLISLAVTRGHGYLTLANTEIFEGSFICVGDKIFEEVTKNMQIEVPEGNYLVTVANNGYGGSKEVTITRDQTTSLNLDELKGEGPKLCRITFDVGVEGAVLTIDGKEVDYSKPVEVQYGIHTIAVGAEGYDTITEKLVVNSEEAEIEIALTAASSSAGTSSDSDDSSSQTNNDTNTNNNSGTDNNTNSSNNTNNNSNTDNSSGTNNDSSSTDYLTTLYNLLTSINDSNSSINNSSTNSNSNNSNSGSTDSYDDLKDG